MAMTVLAFGFAAPALLWGALLAGVPVLIHLLFRRRYRETRWAAMQFLVLAAQKQARSFRIDQWLLLLLRTLIPLGAAVALAGPMWSRPNSASATIRTQRVLVVDASLSLSTEDRGQVLFDRLRQQAESLLDVAQPGDLWQLVRLAGVPPLAVISEPARQTAPLREELRNMTATAERGDPVAAMRTAAALLAGRADVEVRELHLFTDAQRTAWRPVDASQRAELQAAMKALGERARIVWHDVADAPPSNVAVTSLTTSAALVFPQQPVHVSASIRAFGGQNSLPRTLQWFVDDRLSASEAITIAPGEEVTRAFQTTATTGTMRIQVRLDADALPIDDRRFLVVPVRETLPVLLVDGRPSPQPFENATDLLRLALAPQRPEREATAEGVVATVIADGELLSADLAKFAVVMLCDVPRLTERDAEVLRQYVSQGGALVIGVGPGVRTDNYNAVLYRDGKDLLPARLGEMVGDPNRRDQRFVFDAGDFQHPILQPFRGNPNTGFELTQTFAYLKAAPVKDRATAPLMFDTGDPALVEAAYRDGRVLLATTSFDRRWSAWALWGHSFVPMMQEMLRYFSALRANERSLLVGQPLNTRMPVRKDDDRVTIRRAGADGETTTVRPAVDGASIVWDAPQQPGFYSVEAGAAKQWFAVNVDPRESDLSPLSPTELREELLRGLDVDFTAGEAPTTRDGTTQRAETAVAVTSRWLLAVVLVLLLTEPFLAWNRNVGLMVLLTLLTIGIAGTLGGHMAAMAAAVAVAVLGLTALRRVRHIAA